jgi:O-methyltransferase domain
VDALYRVLRALASDGIFEETEPGVFRNTAVSKVLARDGWDDRSARRILETVRAAGSERLIVLDSVIKPDNGPDGAKWLDLLMLALAGGRARTEEQWRALLRNAGWQPTRVGQGAIEAQPA